MTPIEVERLIKKDGWVQVRVRGSHHHYRHPTKPGLVTIPFHKKPKDIPPKTLNNIFEQAGLK